MYITETTENVKKLIEETENEWLTEIQIPVK